MHETMDKHNKFLILLIQIIKTTKVTKTIVWFHGTYEVKFCRHGRLIYPLKDQGILIGKINQSHVQN